MKTMRKFTKVRKLEEIMDTCVKRGWQWDSRLHDAGSSDFIKITFKITNMRVEGHVLFSSFNGKFFGQLKDGTKFDSQKSDHDNVPWFEELLKTFYTD